MALGRRLIAATPVVLLWLLAAASVSSAADYYEFPDDQNYGGAGDNGIPIYEKPLPSYGREVAAPLLIAVEGVVSCKNNTQYHPLKGQLTI